jgi:SAM-dependent methyltransferase
MPLNWIDVTSLSFNTLLLLERAQLSWFPGWVPEGELGLALKGNPAVEWYMRHKCPEINDWLDRVAAAASDNGAQDQEAVRNAEITVMQTINDLVVYAVDPAIYDALPFLGWDSEELTSLVDFAGKTVIDVGSGTGRLAFVVAEKAAHAVFAVEPVGNLRYYLKQKAQNRGVSNLFPVDGFMADLPFPDGFADVTMSGHVYGDYPEAEYREMVRVTKPGGMVILCPGNNDEDNNQHSFLLSQGVEWSRFEEPEDGWKRKYWKTI